jgi:hypothetical protein
VKLTSVCCKSILAKGLRMGAWLEAVPFVSFTGLSGGGVASWAIGLKLLHVVSFRLLHRQRRALLFRQLVAVQQTLKLEKGIVEVPSSRLALDLVVENAHSSLRSRLLIGSQGGRRRRRFGGGEWNDV